MRRTGKIRISKNDRGEYSRLVRNAKAKINRTGKKYGIDLSGEVELPPLESFTTREQFNQWKNDIGSFTNRNNQRYQYVQSDYGVTLSKSQVNEMERVTRIAQKNAIEQREKNKDLPYYFQGQKTDMRVGERSQFLERDPLGITVPSDFDYRKVRSERTFRRQLQQRRQRTEPDYYDRRLIQMKENFKTILELSYNSDADEAVSVIDKIPADDFYEIYLMYLSDFDFENYDSEGNMQEEDGKLTRILSDIEMYYNDNPNKDLKGF